MSASLVGSEMCIRDSSASHELTFRLANIWRVGDSAGSAPTHSTLPRPPAVSYTHLTLPTICSV
eukprot:7452619-Alexandrium_andersonii.AAC.1